MRQRQTIPDTADTKYCNGCKELLPIARFGAAKDSGDGLTYRCRVCMNAHRRIAQKDGIKARSWYKQYGVTPEQYQLLFDKQSGVCAICDKPETKTVKGTLCYLAVDHDHQTGKVRGLLCSGCNEGLGRFKDDVSRLERALAYLRGYNAAAEG